MRLVVQRVSRAEVRVEGRAAGSIGPGLLVLVGVAKEDTPEQATKLAEKLVGLRIFADREGKMNLDVREAGGSVLVVSQFTLYGDVRRGRRPSFERSAEAAQARSLYESFAEAVRAAGVRVQTGIFQAMMQVELVNEGPVTILCDSEKLI